MDIKTEIKQEVPFSEVISHTERESFSQDVAMKLNVDTTVSNKVCETKIKEEGMYSDFSTQNDSLWFSKSFVMNVKQCHNYEIETKTQMNKERVDSENERQLLTEVPVMALNPCIKDTGKYITDTEKYIKEELRMPERTSTEAPCVDDVTKDWVDESFPSRESLRLSSKEASREKSTLFSDKNSESNERSHMTKDSPECETTRKYTSKETDVPERHLLQKSDYSKHYDGGQMINIFAQKNCVQVGPLNNKNYCYESVLVRDNIDEKHDKKLTSPSDQKRHKFIHGRKKPHQCSICKKCFTELKDLKRHTLSHEGIKPHQCDICEKCFTQIQHLKIHKLAHEGIKPNKCDICDKSFTQLQHLRRHKLIHEGIKPHKCDTCGKCFIQLTNLKSHKLTHEGLKPHKCDTCGKCFTGLTNLKRHKYAHEGNKPHKCDTCGKSFIGLADIKRHKLTHESIKPQMCDTCGRCFTQLQHLETHKLIHESIKPYKCDNCGKSYTGLTNLKRHKLSHVAIKP